MNRAFAVCIMGAAAAAAGACTNLFGFDDVKLAPADSGEDVLGPCGHRVPPGPPPNVDAGGSLELVFVMNSFDFGCPSEGEQTYPTLGYDLDSRCTGWGQGPSCLEPPWATHYDDGPQGIDNASGPLLCNLNTMKEIPSDSTGHAVLFRIRGYSGGRNDDRVEVAFFVGVDVTPRPNPLSEGLDTWSIHRGVLMTLPDGGPDVDHPKFVDDAAYVHDGTLVAKLAEVYTGAGTPVAPDYLNHFVKYMLTGNLVQTTNGWEIQNGLGVGRTLLADSMRNFAMTESAETPGEPMCRHKAEFERVKHESCAYLDIASAGEDPETPCDSFSVGLGFTAVQAQLGDAGPPLEPLPPCDFDIDAETCP